MRFLYTDTANYTACIGQTTKKVPSLRDKGNSRITIQKEKVRYCLNLFFLYRIKSIFFYKTGLLIEKKALSLQPLTNKNKFN